MELDRKHFDEYWSRGWTVVGAVFESKEADGIAALALAIADKEKSSAKQGYEIDFSPDRAQQAPRKVNYPFLKDQTFRGFVLRKELTNIIETLLSESPLLMEDQILMKPPGFGSAKPYHQDNFYFRLHPADQALTAWIALDDVDSSNGCLRYIDGSHRGGILPHYPVPGEEDYNSVPPPELIDLSKETLAPVRKGGVIFHHCQTLHTSHRNESDRWRRGYATHWVTANVTCQNQTLDNAYFKRNDFKELLK